MIKKSLVFGMLALLMAAFVSVSCESPVDAEKGEPGEKGDTGSAGPGSVTPGPSGSIILDGTVPSSAVQAAVDSGAPLIIGELVISAGDVDFKTANVTIGTSLLGESARIVRLERATVTFKENAFIASTGNDGVIIANQAVLDKVDDASSKVLLVGSVPAVANWGTATALAVNNATDADVVGTKVAAGSVLYVLNTLSLSVGTFPTILGQIAVLGTLNNTGVALTASELSAAPANGKLTLAGSVISNKSIDTGTVVVTLAGDLTLTGTATLTTGNAALSARNLVAGSTVTFGNNLVLSGTANITGAATITGTSSIAKLATFSNDVTVLTGGTSLALTGGASFAAGKKLTPDGSVTSAFFDSAAAWTLPVGTIVTKGSKSLDFAQNSKLTSAVRVNGVAAVRPIQTAGFEITTGSLTFGDSPDTVVLTKAILAGTTTATNTFTGKSAGVDLGVTATVTVKNSGVITLNGGGLFTFDDDGNVITLEPGAAIDAKSGTAKFGEGTQTDTKISVKKTSTNGLALGTVSGTAGAWIITEGSPGTNLSGSAGADAKIVGALALDFNGTSNVNADPCAVPGAGAVPAAVAGKVTAGGDTTLVFVGTD
ncbi:hypothetical protein AGMMS49942_15950 [Spirochaetia bacterium]|nr:hypothetical protein AGMMS49942_15950 [Spirochaetia bacterium]